MISKHKLTAAYWKAQFSFGPNYPHDLCILAERYGLSPVEAAKIIYETPVPQWVLRKWPWCTDEGFLERHFEREVENCKRYRAELARQYAQQCEVAIPFPFEPPVPAVATRVTSPEWQTWLREIGVYAYDILSERQREILRLRYEQGLTFQEIADVLGISMTGAYHSHYSALCRLRERLLARKAFGNSE